MKTFKEIQDLVIRYADKINESEKYFFLLSKPSQDGRYHLEISNESYHYISVDRSEELDHFTTNDLDELLYKILNNIISSIAIDFEVKNRVAHQDSRRLIFNKKIELFSKIKKNWAIRVSSEINDILINAPYRDSYEN